MTSIHNSCIAIHLQCLEEFVDQLNSVGPDEQQCVSNANSADE